MDINKLQKGNVVKYNNRFDTILKPLNYNEYLIDHCGKCTVVNILDIKMIELSNGELRNLGFEKVGKSIKEGYTTWKKEVITNVERPEIPDHEKSTTLEKVLEECEKGSAEEKHVLSLLKISKAKEVDYDYKQDLIIEFSEKTKELTLEDITGVENFVPIEYKYVYQLQNLLSYIENEMTIYKD